MKKTSAKILSLTLTVLLCLTAFSAAFSVSAAEDDVKTVRIVVENTTYTVENGAPWEGRILDEEVPLSDGLNLLTVIEKLLDSKEISYRASDWGYLQEIDGLAENALGSFGGWSITLNDWFTNDGATAYTVENGGLSAGDEIYVMYSCSWGSDLGSLWGDSTTTLDGIVFEGAGLDDVFDPSVTDYTISVTSPSIVVTPTAHNKNYQVRTYLNGYTPETDGAEIKRSQAIAVKEGDVISVGIGNPAWPTMNDAAKETVYTFTVASVQIFYETGDVNLDGTVDITDATLVQKYAARLETLSDRQLALADLNGDESVDVTDATQIQKRVAGIQTAE